MLYEIYCEKFYQKQIIFNSGLNVVLGTNMGDNSIGKSTFLLIVDYVFGGSIYAETKDIIDNIGSHDIFFSFSFYGKIFKFCRNNIQKDIVWKCNNNYEKMEKIQLDEYCKWLNKNYEILLPELSFRDAVGRYIRVYGKKNCEEHYPLHYTITEKSEKACFALLKLFNEYSPLKEIDVEAKISKSELDAYKKAQAMQFITKISKKKFMQNKKNIEQISSEIKDLSSNLENGLLDVDAAASEEAVYIKQLLSRAKRFKNKLVARYNMIDENGNYVFSATTDTFKDLQKFFPNVSIMHLQEIENFHKIISSVFKTELKTEKSKIQKDIEEYNNIISEYEKQLKDLIKNPKLSKLILKRHSELLYEKDRMQNENDSYIKLQELKKKRDSVLEKLNIIKKKQFSLISSKLNDEMNKINDIIYKGSCNPPILNFLENSYKFFTPDDTGTGIAYKGLIVYDLAVLNLTRLPVLVHDSVILKQISDSAIEQIIDLYSSCGKQVIIAFDKQNSYSEKTYKLLNDAAVLKLSKNGQELFGKSWG